MTQPLLELSVPRQGRAIQKLIPATHTNPKGKLPLGFEKTVPPSGNPDFNAGYKRATASTPAASSRERGAKTIGTSFV